MKNPKRFSDWGKCVVMAGLRERDVRSVVSLGSWERVHCEF